MKATCPNCGKPVPPTALPGLCPECMLKVGAATQTGPAGEDRPQGKPVTPPPLPEPAEIARHFPQLEILAALGRGGMGIVYQARQPRLNRLVALKLLAPEKEKDPQFAERFTREAQALACLNHPNIVTVYDFGEADGLYYLLMEYVDGVSLRELILKRKLASDAALAIVPRICDALQYAHEQGIVHRDIKPENILLDKQGRVKIADFGIAKILGQKGEPSTLTGARDVVGTPNYMAPEQVEKPQTVDHRADIYSLGVVFYEMLTGELPLGKFAPPSCRVHVDVRLDEIVLHALEKEPERRYQQASQVKTDVETIVGGRRQEQRTRKDEEEDGRRETEGRAGVHGGSLRRRKWLWAGAGAAAVFLLLLVLSPFINLGPRQPNLTLTGTVTDAVTGNPIAGARVADNRYGAGPTHAPQEAWTDSEGEYALRTWYEEHSIAASAPGYESRVQTLLTELNPSTLFRRDLRQRMFFALKPADQPRTDLTQGLQLLSSFNDYAQGFAKAYEKNDRSAMQHLIDRARQDMNRYNELVRGSEVTLSARMLNLLQNAAQAAQANAFDSAKGFLDSANDETQALLPRLRLLVNNQRGDLGVQVPEATLSRASARPGFDPVIERVLSDPDSDPHANFLVFESGKVLDLPVPWNNGAGLADALNALGHGVDVLSDASGNALNLFHAVVVPASNEDFDTISRAALVANQALTEQEPGTHTLVVTNWPATYLFRISSGGRETWGVLQVTGFAKYPVGVKLRYKLAREAANTGKWEGADGTPLP